MPTITVLTPSYNRAPLLGRLFASLCAQNYRDFEWLLIDDGSVDETAEVVEEMVRRAPFPARYVCKANGGKHTAINLGVQLAAGRFCAVLDSDDWYAPNCLERLRFHWDLIPEPELFAEVQGLCALGNGRLIGNRFPRDVFDSDYVDLRYRHGVRGDKIGMIRTDVLRAFPFPEDNEGFVMEGLVWNRIATRYQIRGINEVLAFKEYLAGGLSHTTPRQQRQLSAMRLLYHNELLAMKRKLPLKARFKAYANTIRYARHQHQPLRQQLVNATSTAWWLAAAPAGIALHARDSRGTHALNVLEKGGRARKSVEPDAASEQRRQAA